MCSLLSSVERQRVWIRKPFPSCVSWQGEQVSKMNRFQANPFFSVPLIGSLIYCHGAQQEGEPTVSGEKGKKNRELFWTWWTLTVGRTVAEFCFGVFIYISLLLPVLSFLIFSHPLSFSLEVSPSGEHPNDFTAQHGSLTHASNAEVFYFSVSLLFFFFFLLIIFFMSSSTCCRC